MKKLLMVLMVVVMTSFLFTGCALTDWITPSPDPVIPVGTLSADIEIINWVQDEGEIELTYELTNTGTVDIAYYKVLFEVTYTDDSIYRIWYEKVGILFADDETIEVVIEVSNEVARIDIIDLKLTEWKF